MVNKVILIGNLGKDPESRQTANSTVCNLNLGTSSKFKGKDGQYQEKTEWHRVVVWGKTAEFCGNYLKKGSKLYVEGRLETRKWDKNGVDQYTTEVVADAVQNLSPKSDGDRPAKQNTDQYQGTGEDVPF